MATLETVNTSLGRWELRERGLWQRGANAKAIWYGRAGQDRSAVPTYLGRWQLGMLCGILDVDMLAHSESAGNLEASDHG